MKTAFIQQFGHTWRVMERLVHGFDEQAWLHTGRGAITPARLSLHMLQATKYYMQAAAPTRFASGKDFATDWINAPETALPSQEDMLDCICELKEMTTQWLLAMDLAGSNPAFPWAGETLGGVVLFALRHTQFHLGELSSLLNESKDGVVEDHYVKAI